MIGEKGFTLIELLVVIGMIIIMTALMLPNWRLGDKALNLERSAHKVAQDIGRATELALRAQETTCPSGTVSGYGVYFDIAVPTSYLLFADCNGNQKYEPADQDGIVEIIELESGIEISDISISPNLSIVFEPPRPRVFLKPGNPAEVQITLRIEGGTSTRVVKVNNRGLIDID